MNASGWSRVRYLPVLKPILALVGALVALPAAGQQVRTVNRLTVTGRAVRVVSVVPRIAHST